MSTNKIYQFCSGGTPTNTTITLTEGGCFGSRYWTDGYVNYQESTIDITIDASVVSPVDLQIDYQYHWKYTNEYYGGTNVSEYDYPDYVTLPAGQSSITVTKVCTLVEIYTDPFDSRADSTSTTEYTAFVMLNQYYIPECGQPTGCTLELTSVVITPPSQRGLTDGSFVFTLTGATGVTPNITYSINGVELTTSGSTTGFTITSLAPGLYNFYASQAPCYDQMLGIVMPEGEFRTGDFSITSPTNIVASDSPIIYNISTAITNPQGNKTQIKLSVIGTMSDNDRIYVNLTSPIEYNQIFYSKGYPNKSNYFLASVLTDATGTNVGTNSAEEIATSLAQSFENDMLIPQVYFIENSGVDVILTAKESGTKHNLYYGTNIQLIASGISYTLVTEGTNQYDGQITDNYNVYCEVFLNDQSGFLFPDTGSTTDYKRISQLVIPYNVDNNHKFNLSDVLRTTVTTPIPNLSLENSLIPYYIRSYYCKFGEIYPLVPNTNTSKKRYKVDSVAGWVLNSSLGRYSINDMTPFYGEESIFYGPPQRQNVPFITNSPNSKLVQRTSRDFLYFILPKDYGPLIHWKVIVYLTDGTSVIAPFSYSITTSATNSGGIMAAEVSWSSLSLGVFEINGKKIMYYDVVLYQNQVPYSLTKRFVLNPVNFDNMFGVHFENQLGTYDAFDFLGVKEETIDRTISTYEKPLIYGDQGSLTPGYKSKGVYENVVRKKVICNSGWIDKTTFTWLTEMMASKNIYSYTTPIQEHLVLTDFNYVSSDEEDQYNITVTFEYSVTQNNVSI